MGTFPLTLVSPGSQPNNRAGSESKHAERAQGARHRDSPQKREAVGLVRFDLRLCGDHRGGVWAVYSGRYGIGMGLFLGINVLTVFWLYWLFSKRTRPFRLGGK